MPLDYARLATFPLHKVVDGRCGCGDPACRDAGKHALYRYSQLGIGEKWGVPEGCGTAVATGHRSGVFVVDVDMKDGKNGLEALAKLGDFPPTFTVQTPTGGFHFYFLLPDFPVKNSQGKLAEGVDIRGEGGIAVMPGSPHKNGGTYEVLVDADPTPAPAWLLEWPGLRGARLADREASELAPIPVDVTTEEGLARVEAAIEYLRTTGPAIEGEDGSGTLFRVCLHLVRTLELPLDAARELLEAHYNPRCVPPWSGAELQHKLEDARDKSPILPGPTPENWEATAKALANVKHVEAKVGATQASRNAETDDFIARLEEAHEADPTGMETGWVGFVRGDHTEISDKVLLRFPNVRFVEESWYDYDAKRGVWTADGVEEGMRRFIMSLAGAPLEDDKTMSINAGDVNGAMTLTEARAKRVGFFDSAVPGLACRNGFVRIDGSIVAHSPEHRARAYYDLDYVADAEAPAWEAFLDSLFEGDADAEAKKACIVEFFGAALFGLGTRAQRCILALGGGANGKSTLFNILGEMFPGDAVAALPPRAWGDERRVGTLAGKLLNVCGELPRKDLLESDSFKSVIVGDKISACPKYKDEFRFAPKAAHVFATNDLPATVDHSDGFWRRFIVLTFNRQFTTGADATIDQKVLAPDRAGILAALVRGAGVVARRLEAHEAPYTTVTSSDVTKREWQVEVDSVALFLRDMTTNSEKGTRAGTLYDFYKAWCERFGHRPVTGTTFGKRAKVLGCPCVKRRDAYYYELEVRDEPVDGRDAARLMLIKGGI